jgi:hypothetical protein
MKEVWKKFKLSIITITYLLLLLAIIFFFAKPFMGKIEEKADNIQKKTLDNQIDREKIGNISQMEETEKNIQKKNDMLNVFLSNDKEVEFIKKLENLADQTGNRMALTIDDANAAITAKNAKKPSAKKDDKKGILESLSYDSYVSMRINLEGNYLGLINFVNKLENFQYYVNIISLESKKSVEIKDNKNSDAASTNSDIFSAPASSSQQSFPEEPETKKEKDILSSTINVVVYTKK